VAIGTFDMGLEGSFGFMGTENSKGDLGVRSGNGGVWPRGGHILGGVISSRIQGKHDHLELGLGGHKHS